MARNKIIYNGQTLVDLTADTITADKLAYGYTAHDMAGELIVGTMTDSLTAHTKKIMDFSSATTTQTLLSVNEIIELGLTDISLYESIRMSLILISTTHMTNQVVFSEALFPGYQYSSNSINSGIMSYHGSSTSSCQLYAKTGSIFDATLGYIYLSNNGICFAASPTYALKGTYLFETFSKLAD